MPRACDSHAACSGFTMADGGTSCVLLSGDCGSPGQRALPGVTKFLKKPGSPCRPVLEEQRFRELGSIYVSTRAHADVTYVLPPGVPGSIEVSGRELSDVLGVSLDRVMVVDRDAECGVGAPASAVLEPRADAWEAWAPASVEARTREAEEVEWAVTPGHFCPSNNLRVLDYPVAAEHQCYNKCGGGKRCIEKDCFCHGMYSCRGEGCDTAETNALCADEALCRQLASQLYGVVASFDMHQQKPRCFLNVRTAPECSHPLDPDELVESAEFAVHAALPPVATVAARSSGSHPELLRFGPLYLRTAGIFKACFCDSSLFDCNSRAAFGLAAGLVHVSGVAALLSAGKQRGECAQQLGGGLRCYEGAVPVPGAGSVEEAPPEDAVGPEDLFCSFGPDEETRRDPRCRPKGPVPTPSPTPSPVPDFFESGTQGSGLLGPG